VCCTVRTKGKHQDTHDKEVWLKYKDRKKKEPPPPLGEGKISREKSGSRLALTFHPHLAPRLKKEYIYTSTLAVGIHDLFQGEIYLYISFFV
jgi:hypothetical protein